MTCEDLVVACFLDDRAPLAVPELNRERTLERFPKRLNRGFPHGGESDSSFLLEEASMDGEAVFGGLANARSRGD